jgi:hypothetical protein
MDWGNFGSIDDTSVPGLCSSRDLYMLLPILGVGWVTGGGTKR